MNAMLIGAVLLLAGCAHTHDDLGSQLLSAYTGNLNRDDLGASVRCTWSGSTPVSCVLDKTRVTIDIDYLQEFIDSFQQCRDEAYDRRKL